MGENERLAERREMESERETDRERDEASKGGRWMDRLRECITLA